MAAAPSTGGTESASEPVLDADAAASFADELLTASDPFNALTWYRLALHLEPGREDAGALRYRMGLAYELGDRHLAAEQAYLDLAGRQPVWSLPATYRAAMAVAEAGHLDVAALHLSDVELEGQGTGWAPRAGFVRGVLALKRADLAGADRAFATYAERWPEADLVPRAREARALLGEPVPRRSPALAGVLSLVLPGAGQVYAGHAGDGLMAFVAAALPGLWSGSMLYWGIENDRSWAIVTGALLGSAVVFTWSSNVSGAVRGAKRSNRHRVRRRAEAVLGEVDTPGIERTAEDALLELDSARTP